MTLSQQLRDRGYTHRRAAGIQVQTEVLKGNAVVFCGRAEAIPEWLGIVPPRQPSLFPQRVTE